MRSKHGVRDERYVTVTDMSVVTPKPSTSGGSLPWSMAAILLIQIDDISST